MKKDAAAEAAELRLAGTGWLPEVLINRAQPQMWDDLDDAARDRGCVEPSEAPEDAA
jgi:ParB family chromosome partitioning protein